MTYIPLPTDTATTAVLTIETIHHEIHEGDTHRFTDAVTLGAAGTQDYLITTPNTTRWSHFTFYADGTEVTSFQMFEGADRTGTTLQSTFNSNRNSATTAGTTIHKGTSAGTTDGTRIYFYSSGSTHGSASQGATASFSYEVVLKQNTKYIFRVTSSTAANLTNVGFFWYEHVNGVA